MPRLVELYNEHTSGIGDNAQDIILSWQVPTGYVAELVAVGVIPDYDPDTGASYLDTVQIASGTRGDRIGKIFEHSVFSANYNKNILSYGNETTKQPLFKFGEYGNPHSLTYKFASGRYIQIIGGASGGTTGTIKTRALVVLYEKDEVPVIFGVPAERFSTLPGGHDQENPILLYAEVFDNSATSGNAKWEDLASIDLESYEYLSIHKIGVIPHANADALKIFDNRTKEEFPDREPYWKVQEGVNMLPFGRDQDIIPMRELPDFISSKVFNDTTLKIQIRDNGTSIPADAMRVQVLGVYMVRG